MKKLGLNETAFVAQDHDKRLRTALSGAKMSLWEINLTHEMVKWSGPPTGHFSKFSKAVNKSLKAYFKLIHPIDLDEVVGLIQNAKINQNFFNQHRVLWSDNTYHWMEGNGMVFEEKGELKMAGTVQDITEKKRLEIEREDWKVRHELVARAAGIIVYDYNILSGDILWSGNVQEVLGFTSKEMGNIDRWVELIHPEDREDAFEKLEVAQKNLDTYEVYYRFLKSNSSYCDVYDRGTFLERDGSAYRMLGMMSDVTEWRKSREALSESQNRFRSLINNLSIGVGLYDESMVPIVYNEAAFKLLGMTEKQFSGRVAVDTEWNVIDIDGNKVLPKDFPIAQAISTKMPCRQVVMGIYRAKRKDRVWLMVDADPLLDEKGGIRHVICTYSDFSARKRVEEILAEKNEQLMITSDLVSRKNERLLEFAQIVSHNLRSPLSNISGLVDLYEIGSQEEKDDAVAFIREVTKKALSTIDDLNEVLKVQQSEHMDLQVIKFENALEEVKELLSANLKEKNAVITSDFGEADEVCYPNIYMESIFLNLLSNSLRYIAPGKAPKILIKSKRIDRDIHFEFKDNGIGIDLKKNGDDVFKFGKTFHSNKGGKGLGLYLVKNQIRTMGDEIEVESQPNKGTMIRIKFKNQDGRQ